MKLENQWMQEYLDYCKDDLKYRMKLYVLIPLI